MRPRPLILVVDDDEDTRRILRTRLEGHAYDVVTAEDGEAALAMARSSRPDLILLDVMMPKLDGVETARRLKADRSLPFIPVILLTALSDLQDVVTGLAAGADEYLTKPIDVAALAARVAAMLRIKALHDEADDLAARLKAQAAELAGLNKTLEARVAAQVAELERMSRLKRFLAPQVAEAILASPTGETVLASHRADISVVFADLRGFTAFAETAEPEAVMSLLGAYHSAAGELVFAHKGTLERFAGDGIMVIFNDPVPCANHCARAVSLGVAIRDRVGGILAEWNARGAALDVSVGIAAGYATLGRVGFQRRFDYAAIGTVTNIAARLCAAAAPGQILVTARVAQDATPSWLTNPVGKRPLKGLLKPLDVFEVATT